MWPLPSGIGYLYDISIIKVCLFLASDTVIAFTINLYETQCEAIDKKVSYHIHAVSTVVL